MTFGSRISTYLWTAGHAVSAQRRKRRTRAAEKAAYFGAAGRPSELPPLYA